jgi:hypothetical protein
MGILLRSSWVSMIYSRWGLIFLKISVPRRKMGYTGRISKFRWFGNSPLICGQGVVVALLKIALTHWPSREKRAFTLILSQWERG